MLAKIRENWKALVLIFTILSAGASGGTWAFAWASDLNVQVAANTTSRMLQEFERLELIRRQRRLTQVEWLKWCEAGRYLKVFQTCPPR